ncbi:hypothetical protein [Streptomyces sp. NPDC051554]|uniref:hypothetical protein n=1 Tax=Streptomyces sp. NPDC051554 TaxID=3365656 RepID=UPI0037BCC281
MADRHTIDTITTDALNALYEQLEAAEETESQRQLATAREALASATTRAASAEAQAEHWLAFIERFPNHMQFSVLRPDGTTALLPCADWCYACRVENAEAAIARVRALAEANTADGTDGQPCDTDTLWPSEILAVLDEARSLPAAAGPIVVDNPRDTGWFWICTECGAESGKFSTDGQAREYAVTQHPQCPPDPQGPYAFTIPAKATARQCTCTGTDAGLNACINCPTPWPDIPGATRVRPSDEPADTRHAVEAPKAHDAERPA